MKSPLVLGAAAFLAFTQAQGTPCKAMGMTADRPGRRCFRGIGSNHG